MEYQSKTISAKQLHQILKDIHLSTLILYLHHYRFLVHRSTFFQGAKARYYLTKDFLDMLYTFLINRKKYEAADNLQNHFKDVECLEWEDFLCKSGA